jgi:hypothetical protein
MIDAYRTAEAGCAATQKERTKPKIAKRWRIKFPAWRGFRSGSGRKLAIITCPEHIEIKQNPQYPRLRDHIAVLPLTGG